VSKGTIENKGIGSIESLHSIGVYLPIHKEEIERQISALAVGREGSVVQSTATVQLCKGTSATTCPLEVEKLTSTCLVKPPVLDGNVIPLSLEITKGPEIGVFKDPKTYLLR
jgi:hypothetical protein